MSAAGKYQVDDSLPAENQLEPKTRVCGSAPHMVEVIGRDVEKLENSARVNCQRLETTSPKLWDI